MPTCKSAHCVVFSPQEIIRGLSPHLGTAMETPFSPLSFGKSFMKMRSAVPENGCLIFMHYRGGRKKKQTKICKTYTHPRPLAAADA